MSEETTQTAEEPTEEPRDAKDSPVSMELILDGAAFIKKTRSESKPDDSLVRVTTSRGDVFIQKVGGAVSSEIMTGQYRRDDKGNEALSALDTIDRWLCMNIQKCVVKAKDEPLWQPAQVQMMYSGDGSENFYDFLIELNDHVTAVNPHLTLAGNPTALRRMVRYMV